ncbi:hypothetical protein EJ110_NYTH11130, partial [Nymphaea thermarum]
GTVPSTFLSNEQPKRLTGVFSLSLSNEQTKRLIGVITNCMIPVILRTSMGNLFSYFHGHSEPKPLLLSGSVSDSEDEESEVAGKICYIATFDELEEGHVQYDTIIWVLISLLLVLAWGVGLVMLLYLPVKRYILRKDLHSRKLYVTSEEIVYKVSRPSFLPFLGSIKIEKHMFLPLVIGVVIEQGLCNLDKVVSLHLHFIVGCLQSVYGIHTCRIESVAFGKTAPVDELQVQGVTNPGQLRKPSANKVRKREEEKETEGEREANFKSCLIRAKHKLNSGTVHLHCSSALFTDLRPTLHRSSLLTVHWSLFTRRHCSPGTVHHCSRSTIVPAASPDATVHCSRLTPAPPSGSACVSVRRLCLRPADHRPSFDVSVCTSAWHLRLSCFSSSLPPCDDSASVFPCAAGGSVPPPNVWCCQGLFCSGRSSVLVPATCSDDLIPTLRKKEPLGCLDRSTLDEVIMVEAARSIQGVGRYGKPSTGEADNVIVQSRSVNEASPLGRSLASSMKMTASPPYPCLEPMASIRSELMLNKLEEIEQSVKVCIIKGTFVSDNVAKSVLTVHLCIF